MLWHVLRRMWVTLLNIFGLVLLLMKQKEGDSFQMRFSQWKRAEAMAEMDLMWAMTAFEAGVGARGGWRTREQGFSAGGSECLEVLRAVG